MKTIKVAARSRTAAVAGAIAGVFRENGFANIQAIGAGATNQALKATILAKEYLADEGKSVVLVPSFINVLVDGEERTAVHMLVESQ